MQTPKCEVCRNDYDKAFQIIIQGRTHTFDSFECAIEALAPRCAHFHVRVLGHGMEKGTRRSVLPAVHRPRESARCATGRDD